MEIDMFGPRVLLLSSTDVAPDDFVLFKGTLPPGAVIPLHSHIDRELFFVLSGDLQLFREGCWTEGREGDVFDVTSNTKHALRNESNAAVVMLVVTTQRLAGFFTQVGRRVGDSPLGPPTPADLARFVQVAHASGHWLASPAENASIGLQVAA